MASMESSLEHHELLKIKIRENIPANKKSLSQKIEKATSVSVVQIMGKTTLHVYRPFREDLEIMLHRTFPKLEHLFQEGQNRRKVWANNRLSVFSQKVRQELHSLTIPSG